MQKNNMRQIRKSKNITLEGLSDATGISVGYLCHLEKGTRQNPSMHIMEGIAIGLRKNSYGNFFSIDFKNIL